MKRRAETEDPLLFAEDILSAKWTLPVLRVLGHGPARFSGLRAAIPAVSANILASRLRNLEEAGIIRKKALPPPADCQVYALTDIGDAARPILLAIRQWAAVLPGGSEQQQTSGPQDGDHPPESRTPQEPSSTGRE